MAPTYKVTYFDITALGEPIRFLLSYGKLDFEDIRVTKEKNWPELKPKMPFGQVPILEENGKVAWQSMAICRYLAKKVKLVGNDDWENLEIDMVVDTINDLRQKISPYHYGTDEKAKEQYKPELFGEILPYFLERLDKMAKTNNGHMAIGKLTWADMYLASLWDYLAYMLKSDVLDKYPNLVAVKTNVHALPEIKAWLEKRPKTDC